MSFPLFVSVDFETRSTTDLRKSGVYRYAEDPHTDVWCMAYRISDGPVKVWTMGQPFPSELRSSLDNGAYLRAWNAQFERVIWQRIMTPRHGWPEMPNDRFVCVMVLGKAAGLPGSLAQAAQAMKLTEGKDMAGNRLMLQMAKPRRVEDDTPVWWDDPTKLKRLYAYCAQDVVVESALFDLMPPAMNKRERAIYLLDQSVNDKGVALDTGLIHAAKKRASSESAKLSKEMKAVTGGAVAGVTKLPDLKAWLAVKGVHVDSLDKAAIGELLSLDGLTPDVRRAVEIRGEAAKSSVQKLAAMLACVGKDGRARGLLQYYGAGTGRWAGRLIQPQNFPRGAVKITPDIIEAIRTGGDLGDSPLETLSSALRGTIIAPPNTSMYAADYAQIEARVVAWLAGQDDLLTLFASGGLVYETMAATIFRKPVGEVTPEERQVGKMAILGCGFQMGARRFAEQAGVDEELAKVAVTAYRERNYRIKALWYRLQDTAISAVRLSSRQRVEVPGTGGKLAFRVDPRGWLAMDLPSGRSLWYRSPRLIERPVPWSDTETRPAVVIDTLNGYTRKWEAQTMYGGLWTENATQAVARDIMADALLRVAADGRFQPILTVHDEILAEGPTDGNSEDFVSLLAQTPRWAAGCPIAAEGWKGDRYRK